MHEQAGSSDWDIGGGDKLLRGAFEHNTTTIMSCTGPQIDDPIGLGHNSLMMFDDDDRSSGIRETIQHVDHGLDIRKMQTRRRFVEDDDRSGICSLGRQMRGQLEALPLAT